MNALILNTGGSLDYKFYLVEDISGDAKKTVIEQKFDGKKDASYETIAKKLAPKILEQLKVMGKKIDVILFRTPAMNVNIQGLTFLTYNLVQNYKEYRAILHGSEVGMFLSVPLSEELEIPVIFGPGIPTDDLPAIVKMTGHPDIENEALSHYEAVIGGVKLAVQNCFVSRYEADGPFGQEGDVAIFLMLGSGMGVYLVWRNQQRWKLIHSAVRHNGGALSEKSCGNLPILPFIDWFEDECDLESLSGKEALEELKNKCKSLSGRGGFKFWNEKWVDFITFMKDVEDESSEDHELATTLYNKIIYDLVSKIGEARGAASFLTGNLMRVEVPIFLYGGVANNERVVRDIKKYVYVRDEVVFNSVEIVEGDPEFEFYLDLLREYEKNPHSAIKFDSLV